MRKVVIGFVSAVAFLLSVQPAAAQGVEFSAGYNFLRFIEDDGENLPAGWGASVSGGGSGKLRLVGDISGNYKDGVRVHFFQGGAEFGFGNNAKATPYVRALVGLGRISGDGFSDNSFAFTPEFGVRVAGNGRVGARIAAGFPIMRDDGFTTKTFRLFVGVSIQ